MALAHVRGEDREADGSAIAVEQRPAEEVTTFAGHPVVPVGVDVDNHAFDITPAELVTAIVTEAGVVRPPYAEGLARLAAAPSTIAPER